MTPVCDVRRMVQEPALRDVFLVKEAGQWRAPKVNETCCRRPALADLLQKGAYEGPYVRESSLVLLRVVCSSSLDGASSKWMRAPSAQH